MAHRGRKRVLFDPPSIPQLLKQPEYTYPRQNPIGIARILMDHMRHPEVLIVRIPLEVEANTGSADSKAKVRYGNYLELREEERPGLTSPDIATPFELLMEHFPLSLSEPVPIGFKWRIPGTDNTYMRTTWQEMLERAVLSWYDRHKHPKETPALQFLRIGREVRPLPVLEDEHLDERLARNGMAYFSKVPSRRQPRTHKGAVYHVPHVFDKRHIGRVWRRLKWRTGSTYNQVLHAGQPSEEQEDLCGELEIVTAEQWAQLDKVIRYSQDRGNTIPRKYSPVIRWRRRMFDVHANMNRTVVMLDGEKPRFLQKHEKSYLLGIMMRLTRGSITEQFAQEERYALGRLGRLIEY